MTEKIIIDGKNKCPCYIDRPLHRYDKGCLIQSQVFAEQQTEEKPILRCDEIQNCPIKETYKQLLRKTAECNELSEGLEDLNEQLQAKEQKCEKLKAEIKLTKEMLIQNTSETDKNTIPEIIEEFISQTLLDRQNDEGYTIPVFIQVEDMLEVKEEEEEQLLAEQQKVKELEECLNNQKHTNAEFEQERNAFINEHLKNKKYKQALEEIKPTLEYYANSRVGIENPDGTYTLLNPYKSSITGENEIILNYDPRPAKKALQKCEVLND